MAETYKNTRYPNSSGKKDIQHTHMRQNEGEIKIERLSF